MSLKYEPASEPCADCSTRTLPGAEERVSAVFAGRAGGLRQERKPRSLHFRKDRKPRRLRYRGPPPSAFASTLICEGALAFSGRVRSASLDATQPSGFPQPSGIAGWKPRGTSLIAAPVSARWKPGGNAERKPSQRRLCHRLAPRELPVERGHGAGERARTGTTPGRISAVYPPPGTKSSLGWPDVRLCDLLYRL